MKINIKNKYIIIYITIFLITIATLISFNQPIINKDGMIKLWCGVVQSSCNSQEITDWYTPSHFSHGLIFFFLFNFLFTKFIKIKNDFLVYIVFLFSLLVECFWEILENTPFIIERYRSTTSSFDYSGDSVLNSFFDIIFMSLGFLFAKKFGFKISLFVLIILELFTLYFIKDNLILNILMLTFPIEAIRNWQMS